MTCEDVHDLGSQRTPEMAFGQSDPFPVYFDDRKFVTFVNSGKNTFHLVQTIVLEIFDSIRFRTRWGFKCSPLKLISIKSLPQFLCIFQLYWFLC